jgi:hypothetical protein
LGDSNHNVRLGMVRREAPTILADMRLEPANVGQANKACTRRR